MRRFANAFSATPQQSLQIQQTQRLTMQMQQQLTTATTSSQTSPSLQILLSSEIQSGHQNQFFELQLQLRSSPSASVGPTVELFGPTKPYEIGDTIKVGGRNLRSDISSLKYWLEDDITVTETASGGHILNMAGYSYLIKNHGKNFTSWECEHRRHRQCSSVAIRSSDPTVKNYFRIYSIQGEHNHEPASENVEVRKFKQRIKERCRLELSSPRTIYDDELRRGKFSPQMLAILPTFYNMRK